MKAAILLSFVVLAIGSGGLLSYVWIAVRLARGEKLVEWTPRRYVPWGLVDLIWPVFLLLFFGAALLVVLGRDDQLILLDAAMKFSAMTVAIPLILLRTRGAASDMTSAPPA